MRLDQFDFQLPEDLIALRPAVPRDSARMLVIKADGSREHAHVRDLPRFLTATDVLVTNDTKVIAARLRGRRIGRGESEPRIEVLLHRRRGGGSFHAFARPARKLLVGDRLLLGSTLMARVTVRGEGGGVEIEFEAQGAALDEAIAQQGEVPLPPYIAAKRKLESQDTADYQTMFATRDGSVAAPTAGLHFTPELMARLAARGVDRESLTLHVGAGTFLPVTAADARDHHMHSEWAEIDGSAAIRLNAARDRGGRIVAVGTTSLRALESAAEANGRIRPFSGETDIFITPGYEFRTAELLLSNFHLPRSTLLMLVSAFSGIEAVRAAYDEAIRERYRFYSYGDACLLFRARR